MRLIIVSNRLPVTIEDNCNVRASIGGLAKGLDAFLQNYTLDADKEYLWLGWAGSKLDECTDDSIQAQLLSLNCHTVDIDNDLMDDFYTGFCNKTIWPIFHNLTAYFSYNEQEWQTYKKVNQAFAENILKIAKPGDIIWIHDYHLLLVAQYLKEQNPDLIVGSFLHIPFPSFDTFQFLPNKCRTEILNGMLGANLIGFHTYEYSQHFIKCITRMLGYDHNIENIMANDRLVKADVYPMGIDYDGIQKILANNQNQQKNEFRNINNKYKTILSIDRLDYTKGIANRLLAYEEFLQNNEAWHNKVVLILIVAPSRDGVEHYNTMKRQIDELVGSINGKFGNVDWTPISYQYKSFDSESLISLYAASDIALVTPLMDGMNLIAKEYIAAKTSTSGVLILSESAGAAKELMDALIISPNSIEEMAAAIKAGLEMEEGEKLQRLAGMQLRLKRYNVIRWGNNFIDDLVKAHENQKRFASQFLTNIQLQSIMQKYQKSKSRALIFDYDGTLVPINKNINMAYPDINLLNILGRLTNDHNNDIYIISGRDKNILEKWFTDLNLTIIAEHGAWIRESGKWKIIRPLDSQDKSSVLLVLEEFMDRLPGSLIEEKEFSFAWHYRNADPENAARLAQELLDTLVTLTASSNLQVLPGHKVIEVRPTEISKGIIGKLIKKQDYDCIIAVGDDVTDEDMFKALPPDAISIKIGTQASYARFNLNTQDKAREFIHQLSNLSE